MSKCTRLYVCGPVSGREDRNRGAFERARYTLIVAGYDVVTPHDIIPEDADDATERDAIMQRCYDTVSACDGVALLPDWADSRGATQEVDHACSQHIPVGYIEHWVDKGLQ